MIEGVGELIRVYSIVVVTIIVLGMIKLIGTKYSFRAAITVGALVPVLLYLLN